MRFELAGGIGNQLFQIVAAEFMACSYPEKQVNLAAPPSRKFRNHGFLPDMNFLEAFLGVSPKVFDIESLGWGTRVGRVLYKNPERTQLTEVGWVDTKKILESASVSGYFQTHIYAEELQTRFGYRLGFETVSGSSVKAFEEKTCGIHLRRGDYTRHKDTLGLLSKGYFNSAVSAAQRDGFNRFVIFSDDPNAIADIIDLSDLTNVEILPPETSPLDTLAIASKLAGLIASNSSFSWWAAFPHHETKSVYYPAKWYRSLPTPRWLIPVGWKPIQNDWEN